MLQFLAQTAWFIPCYPLIGMVLSLLWTPSIIRRTGPRPAGYINLVTTLCAFLHGVLSFPSTWHQPPQYLTITWLEVSGLTLDIPLELSTTTIGAGLVITSLNLLAQIYAIGYLEMDWGWARFFALMALFETGMCSLALCNSLFFSYIILEILTLATYLIVGTWFNQSLVVTGARDAFLTKRVGDLFLLMGVLAIFPLAGTWDYRELAIWAQTATVDPTLMAWLGLGLVAGPMGKCAQFPLHLWLDEAMEGPVPGTILRNSVVVSTGAWVLIKLSPVISLSPLALTTMIGVGSITAIGGTLIAIAQIDIKRALSYSASSYMGLIFIAVGTQHLSAALLLMLTYALAMALLIMSTGSIILNTITQDLTQLGGLWSRRPITGLCYLVGAAGLIGLPPLGSFWALLELIDSLWAEHPLLVGIVVLVNALTGLSITREFGLIFAGARQQMTVRAPENIWLVTLPTTLLAGTTIHLPIILQRLGLLPQWSALNHAAGLLLVVSSIVGCAVGVWFYVSDRIPKPIQLPWVSVQNFFAFDMYTPTLYRSSIVSGVDGISRLTDWLDRTVVDGVANWIARTSVNSGEILKYGNFGQTQLYLLTIISGVFVITLLLLRSLL
ncbi:NAD(P)H-quinone oxidoreductase subunit F [Acaryochloris sp. IP29b_bin.148]|uniref:NAD(P)H-quinone oxidoreductase subunit F n=1 Tax=Acaryochloris sp. IP29b_bin.148 TaxID=2969218 RepID=UPI00260FD820|nr:NAD(P)H-quinone oxidoreductase subunit F [Acaryochloris sp. IP29b_bin.148]